MGTQQEKPKAKTKKQLLREVETLDNSLVISMTVEEFKANFNDSQLNRGWTNPQINFVVGKAK